MHPKKLSIKDFTYELPAEKIAKYPLAQRDESKLLVYKNGGITKTVYKHLDEQLPANALLIFNNTKVIEARLLFEKATGGTIELFCLEPDEQYPDITTAMLQKSRVFWKCLVGGAKKWKEGALEKTISTTDGVIRLTAKKTEQFSDYFLIEFEWNDANTSFAEVLHYAGVIPLPPYLNRKAEEGDKSTYQTIYARHDGSVAAPTAGLHFTEGLFKKLDAKHIQRSFVTLHVGAGTFKPVKAATMEQHEMHAEFIDVTKQLIAGIITKLDNTIIAVGTTSLRTIESLYWMGVKLQEALKTKPAEGIAVDDISINQWDAYELSQNIPAKEALQQLVAWMDAYNTSRLITKTQIIIAPGYSLRVASGLITNFHQPQSTLLLLVAAIVGDAWQNVYNYALRHNFRFLSYGDGSLLFKKPG